MEKLLILYEAADSERDQTEYRQAITNFVQKLEQVCKIALDGVVTDNIKQQALLAGKDDELMALKLQIKILEVDLSEK